MSIKEIRDGRKVVLSPSFFITGNDPNGPDPWNGLANKFNKYARIRFSRLNGKEYSEAELKKKMHEYNELFETLVQERFIKFVPGDDGTLRPSTNTLRANRIRGFPLGYLQGLLMRYDRTWLSAGAILAFLIGLSVQITFS